MAVPTIYAPGALEHRNYYHGHATRCTADEFKQASLLGGHTWNIINNRQDHESYLPHVRNEAHYIDAEGRSTSHWIEKKRRIDLDGDGIDECHDSSHVQEVMTCPPTAGKEDAKARARQIRQLCQASAPSDFLQYSARRAATVAPPTPGRGGSHDKKLPFQHRLRDLTATQTPRTLDRQLWSARRGEPRLDPQAPEEHERFRSVHQLQSESHLNLQDSNFADAIHSARRGDPGASGSAALAGAKTDRSTLGETGRLRAGSNGAVRHSAQRVEASQNREISHWHLSANLPHEKDRVKRGDPFYARPIQFAGSSSVKYDILSNERKHFVY